MFLESKLTKVIFVSSYFAFLLTLVTADIFEECNDRARRTFIASPKGCSFYIYCDGDASYEGECANGDYFSVNFQTCDPREFVDCNDDNEETTTSAINIPIPTVANTTTTITTTTTTSVSTNNTIIIPSTIAPTAPTAATTNITSKPPPPATITIPTAASSAATTITTLIPSLTPPTTISTLGPISTTTTSHQPPISSPTSPIVINTECPLVDNPLQITFLPHPKSCSDYFVCFHGKAVAMFCSSMLHFDIRTGQCDYAENVKCLTEHSTAKEQCQSHTVDMYPHPTNCNYYYFCKNGFLLLQQCPFFTGWDYEKRACMALNQAKCYNNRKGFF